MNKEQLRKRLEMWENTLSRLEQDSQNYPIKAEEKAAVKAHINELNWVINFLK